jgi:hypothetical protein
MCFVANSHTLAVRANVGFSRWAELEAALNAHALRVACKGVGTRRGGMEQDRYYEVVLRTEAELPLLFDKLTALDGVLSVQLDG